MLQPYEGQAKDLSSTFIPLNYPDSPGYYENAALSLAIEAIRYGGGDNTSPYYPLLSALFDTPALFFPTDPDPLDNPQIKRLKENYNKAYQSLLDKLVEYQSRLAWYDLSVKLQNSFIEDYNRVRKELTPRSTEVIPNGYKTLPLEFTRKGKTLSIPAHCYGVQPARTDADSFFYAMAAALNNLEGYPHLKRRIPWDVKGLRQLCFDFYSKNKELVNSLNLFAKRGKTFDYRGVLLTPPPEIQVIAGTPNVEGAIICEALNINLHIAQLCVDEQNKVLEVVDFHVEHRKITTQYKIEALPPHQSNFDYDESGAAQEAPGIIDVSGDKNNCGLFALALAINLALKSNPGLKDHIAAAHADFFEKLDEEAVKKTIDVRTNIVGINLRAILHEALTLSEAHRQKTKPAFSAFCLSLLLGKSDVNDYQDMIAFIQANQHKLTDMQQKWQVLSGSIENELTNFKELLTEWSNGVLVFELNEENQCRQGLLQIMNSANKQTDYDYNLGLNDLFKNFEDNQNPLLGISKFYRATLRVRYNLTHENTSVNQNLGIAIENFLRKKLIHFSCSGEKNNFKRYLLGHSEKENPFARYLLLSACLLTPSVIREGNAQWDFPIVANHEKNTKETCASLFVELYLQEYFDEIYTAYCKRVQTGGELNADQLKWFESVLNRLNPEVDHQLSVHELECLANLLKVKLKVHDFKEGAPDRASEESLLTVTLTNPRKYHWQVVSTAQAISPDETKHTKASSSKVVRGIPTLHIVEEGHCYYPVLKKQPEKPVKLQIELYAIIENIKTLIPKIIGDLRQRYHDSLPETAAARFFVKAGARLKDNQTYNEFIKEKQTDFCKTFDLYCESTLISRSQSIEGLEDFVNYWYPQIISDRVKWCRGLLEQIKFNLEGDVDNFNAAKKNYDRALAQWVVATGPQGLRNIGIPTTWKYRDRIDLEMFSKMIRKVDMRFVDPMTGDTLALMAARAGDRRTYDFFQDNFPDILIKVNKKGLSANIHMDRWTSRKANMTTGPLDANIELLIDFEKELRRLHRQCSEEQALMIALVDSPGWYALLKRFRYPDQEAVRVCYATTLDLIVRCTARILRCRSGNYTDFGQDLLKFSQERQPNTQAGYDLTLLLARYLQKIKGPNIYQALQPPVVSTLVNPDKKIKELQGQLQQLTAGYRTREQELETQLANTQKELAAARSKISDQAKENNALRSSSIGNEQALKANVEMVKEMENQIKKLNEIIKSSQKKPEIDPNTQEKLKEDPSSSSSSTFFQR